MAIKLNKSILEIIADFGDYLHEGLAHSDARIAAAKAKLANAQVDISKFNEYITYADSYKVAVNPNKEVRIPLTELYDFHRTGRFRNFDIRPRNTNLATLRWLKGNLPNTYMTGTGIRPLKNDITHWNGSLVLDVDIRKALFDRAGIELDDESNRKFREVLHAFRAALHANLCKYHWYLWTTFSSTFGGVHIRTKSNITNMDEALTDFLSTQNMEALPTSHDIYTLLFNINALSKYTVCYEELLSAARVFNEAYGLGDDLKWVASAVDDSCLKISQGMCVAFDAGIALNPNFKDAPLFIDLYGYAVPESSALLKADSFAAFLRSANPLGRNRIPKSERKVLTDEETQIANEIAQDFDDVDIEVFRAAEAAYDRGAKGRNGLYWRVVNYLYWEFTGRDEEMTFSICKKLFDPRSRHSSDKNIRSSLQSVIKSDYGISAQIRSLMTQVLQEGRWRRMIEEDERPYRLSFEEQNTYTLGPMNMSANTSTKSSAASNPARI